MTRSYEFDYCVICIYYIRNILLCHIIIKCGEYIWFGLNLIDWMKSWWGPIISSIWNKLFRNIHGLISFKWPKIVNMRSKKSVALLKYIEASPSGFVKFLKLQEWYIILYYLSIVISLSRIHSSWKIFEYLNSKVKFT